MQFSSVNGCLNSILTSMYSCSARNVKKCLALCLCVLLVVYLYSNSRVSVPEYSKDVTPVRSHLIYICSSQSILFVILQIFRVTLWPPLVLSFLLNLVVFRVTLGSPSVTKCHFGLSFLRWPLS